MSKKSKTIIAAFGVLLLLSLAYYGSTVWTKGKDQEASQSYTPSLTLGNLENVELVKIEVSDLTLESDNGIWKLTSLYGKEAPAGITLDQNIINNFTWYLTSVWIEHIVEEKPEDLGIYGLDNPFARTVITNSSGEQTEYILGNMTPSRTSYYIMEAGDPKIYSVSAFLAESLCFSLDDIRQRSISPSFQLYGLESITIESPASLIEIAVKPDNAGAYLSTIFSGFIITSPYRLPRGVQMEPLSRLLTPLNNLRIEYFIDDDPLSLAPYGLDKPVKFSLKAGYNIFELLIGNEVQGMHFAKLPNAPGVFTLFGMESIINIKPFDLIEKFPLLVNISLVDHLEVRGGEKHLSLDFIRQSDNEEFFLNGKKVQDRSFRSLYEAIVGLLSEAEYQGAPIPDQNRDGSITIEYTLNTPPGEKLSLTLIPYNRDFYAILQEGTTEFLISREEVNKIFTRAEAAVYE